MDARVAAIVLDIPATATAIVHVVPAALVTHQKRRVRSLCDDNLSV